MLPLVFAALSLFQSLPLGGIPVSSGGGGAVFKGESHNNGDTSATSIITPGTLSIATGDLIVVAVGAQAPGSPVVTVTCGASNTLTQATFAHEAGGYNVWVFYKENASASTSACTASFNNSYNFRAIEAVNYSGVLTSSSLKNTSCNSVGCDALAASSTSRTTQNVTTTTANALLIGLGVDWNGGDVDTAANGYTKRVNGLTPFLFDKNVTTTGTYPSGNFATSSPADQYLSIFLVFGTL